MFFIPRNVSPQNKLQAVSEYLAGKGSQKCIAKKYGCGENNRIADIIEIIHEESPDKGYRRIRDELERY
ncbi:hypothetical protein, partial [Lacrimispora amygdalina]|uniref:hypothetical protein n=1 Tax=Lacrimispora amygdalina TaxID=253257 RepID=UPI0031F98604